MNRYINLTRKAITNSWKDGYGVKRNEYHYEIMKISPENILFFSQRLEENGHYYYTKLYLMNGTEVVVKEDVNQIERLISKYYEEKEKENVDKIVISKNDIVKNFIFKNLG